MSRPDPKVVFAASITRIVGDDQLTVNFNGSDQGELRSRLRQASEVMNQHTKTHNDKVLDLTDTIRQKAEKVKGDIAREERQRLADAGLIPQALVRSEERIPKEANGGPDPAGSADLRADS
jgi:hypothetical protein